MITHKGTTARPENSRSQRSYARKPIKTLDQKINDLTFADDIPFLENDLTRAQHQLTFTQQNASAVGLDISIEKNVLR